MNLDFASAKRGDPQWIKKHLDTSAPKLKQRSLAEYRNMLQYLMADLKAASKGETLFADLLAGITVAAVALPLNLALSIACGLPAQTGIIAGIVGGFFAAVFGGTSLQVTGPAAALNVMVLMVAQQHGATGVAATALVSGVVQLILAFARMGNIAKMIPEAVLAGFTTGVGLKLLDSQIPVLLGFEYSVSEIALNIHRPEWLHDVSWLSVVSGLLVAILVITTKEFKKFPAALIGITVVSALSIYLPWEITRVGNIPSQLPLPHFPELMLSDWLSIVMAAIPLGILSGAESLISSNAIDRMSKTNRPHQANLELFGQGIANFATGLMSGMPVSGVIVRTSVNFQSGAKTRLSALFHSVFLAVALLYFSKSMSLIPLAALAGLLCVVGVRLIEVKTFFHLLKVEKIAFTVTLAGVATGHLVAGMSAGLALIAAHHFLNRKQTALAQQKQALQNQGVRAQILQTATTAQRPKIYNGTTDRSNWATNLRQKPKVSPTAYVHPEASVIGDVFLDHKVHVAADTSIRADEGTPFFFGRETNIQDGVVIHALKEKWVEVAGKKWAVYVGQNVSMAHQALVHGPCFIGDHTFVGFKAVVHDSIVGSKCFIGIGATVVGVEIPSGRFVPHGMIVDTQQKASTLPEVTDAQKHFNEDVVEVNTGLATAYHEVDTSQSSAHSHSAVYLSSKEKIWNQVRF